jgi:hypothetical protein
MGAIVKPLKLFEDEAPAAGRGLFVIMKADGSLFTLNFLNYVFKEA